MAGLMRGAATMEQWEVEFSRFFNSPDRNTTPSQPLPPGLRTKPRRSAACAGTWLVAASPAVLSIIKTGHAAGGPVLHVSVRSVVYEEHFVSNLSYTWPQVAPVSQSSIRGSRIVFMSYWDSSPGQIEKFAVRFLTNTDAAVFLDLVKECSGDIMDFSPPSSDFVYANSSPSEIMSSNRLHYRRDEGSSFEEPIATYGSALPAVIYDTEQRCSPADPVLKEINSSGLPPSFSELLSNCSNYAGTDESINQVETGFAARSAEYAKSPFTETAKTRRAANTPEESLFPSVEIKDKLLKCMSDASFHDMLFKIEKVIDELGGDMLL